MQGTNVLFGQIAVVFGIVISGVWGATQWTAAALGYQLRLGSPWFDLLGTPMCRVFHEESAQEKSEAKVCRLRACCSGRSPLCSAS